MAARTPASIFYTFQYTLHINYYDHSDYQVACSIYEEEPCEIALPGSMFSTEKYVLLAYVRPNVELSSSTNHLCVTANRSDSVYLIIGMATSIAALALLGTVVIIIVVVVGIRRGIEEDTLSYKTLHRLTTLTMENCMAEIRHVYKTFIEQIYSLIL